MIKLMVGGEIVASKIHGWSALVVDLHFQDNGIMRAYLKLPTDHQCTSRSLAACQMDHCGRSTMKLAGGKLSFQLMTCYAAAWLLILILDTLITFLTFLFFYFCA
jgi:hypothetical protein